uniref:Uncharacterized protein n=1 Tax=Chromera velia CCMP2878 TaxID=1169474 RepID=A0A0G4HNK1_9ALVE|eukprot:Cvel_7712.t1-p1 / transcript=Cvel_7712.t1 / gene=Cvel_7712 / organism=Chromera_velia_CCMP2878 / gene_product=hypothetical protein / transcript_product=hypothetical protein / location=Cvel_scaffold409:85183-87328(-) / protein_length=566 / sequence_SO=supercontig / SO=protein_coding / is_pseudo=false
MPWVEDYSEFYDEEGNFVRDPHGRWRIHEDFLGLRGWQGRPVVLFEADYRAQADLAVYHRVSYSDVLVENEEARWVQLRIEEERDARERAESGAPKVKLIWKADDRVGTVEEAHKHAEGKYCKRCLHLTGESDGCAWEEGRYRTAIPRPPFLLHVGGNRPRREGKAEASGDLLSDASLRGMVDFLCSGMQQSWQAIQTMTEKEKRKLPDGTGSVALKTLSCLRTAKLLQAMMAARESARRTHATQREKEEYECGLEDEAREWEDAKMELIRTFASRGDQVCENLLRVQRNHRRRGAAPTLSRSASLNSYNFEDTEFFEELEPGAGDHNVEGENDAARDEGGFVETGAPLDFSTAEPVRDSQGMIGEEQQQIQRGSETTDPTRNRRRLSWGRGGVGTGSRRVPDLQRRGSASGCPVENVPAAEKVLDPLGVPHCPLPLSQTAEAFPENAEGSRPERKSREGFRGSKGMAWRRRRSSLETVATVSPSPLDRQDQLQSPMHLQTNREASHTAVRPSLEHPPSSAVGGPSGGGRWRWFRGETTSDRLEREKKGLLRRRARAAEKEAERTQ